MSTIWRETGLEHQILGQAFFHLDDIDCVWFMNNTGENNHCSLCTLMNANVLLADGLFF